MVALNSLSVYKRVAIVAPQFPPSNLTAGHRSRLFVRHLREFGYEPIVITVEPRWYEEMLDPELERLLPDDLQIVRTRALPTWPVRLVGDIGIRSFPFIYRCLDRLCRERRVELLYFPIPPNYTCLLGPILFRRHAVPYVIDYIDPWAYPITDEERGSWKARLSHWLARKLEPLAVRHAAGITGVAEAYFADVLKRHPHLQSVPTAGIPYGSEPLDYDFIMRTGRRCALLDRLDLADRLVFVYAGAILPRAINTLRTFLKACQEIRQGVQPEARRLHVLFVGTGSRVNDPGSGMAAPIAKELGAGDFVTEVADRQPYLEVLALLRRAHAVVVVGSSERHYTASKIFQALESRRPILAILHKDSSAAAVLRQAPNVELATFCTDGEAELLKTALSKGIGRLLQPSRESVDRSSFLQPYTAREMTRQLAKVFTHAIYQANVGQTPCQ